MMAAALLYAFLCSVGIVMMGGDHDRGLLVLHVGAVLAGGLVIVLCRRYASSARVRRAVPWLFLGTLLASLLVFVPGLGIRQGGARRLIILGPLVLEPALAMAFLGALLLGVRTVFGALALLSSGVVLVLQPDYSTLGVLALAAAAVAGTCGLGPVRALLLGAGLLCIALILASREPYVVGRVQGFLHAGADRFRAGYEPLKLDRTLAAPHWIGVGLGRGEGRSALHAADSDYMFALIVEELGAAMGIAVAAAYGGLAWLCIRRLEKKDRFARALVAGSTVFLIAPALLHMGVCLRLVPITSVHLPFVSYGAIPLLVSAAALGLTVSSSGSSWKRDHLA